MPAPRDHEPPEVIATWLASLIPAVRPYLLNHHEQVQRHGLRLLRWLCRAADHGRLPRELRPRYEGMLRNVRPEVLALQRLGVAVPPLVRAEVDRARDRVRRRPTP